MNKYESYKGPLGSLSYVFYLHGGKTYLLIIPYVLF
jgi:hypothetical protein